MKCKSVLLMTLLAVFSCDPKNTSETTTDTPKTEDLHPADDKLAISDPAPEISKKEEPSLVINSVNLTQYTFSTFLGIKVTFSENGGFEFEGAGEGGQYNGTWSISDHDIILMVREDTLYYEVDYFTRDELKLKTSDPAGGKLLGETVDREKTSYTPRLYRNVYSVPFPTEAVAGPWSNFSGGYGFSKDGTFAYSEVDCACTGSWNFDGEYFKINVTHKDCDGIDFDPSSFRVIRLSANVMVLKNAREQTEVWIRHP